MTRSFVRIRNWDKFQQYKDREPKWIKLYRSLNRNYEWCQLSESARAHLVGLWLLAAETENKIPLDAKWIKSQIGARSEVKLDELVTYEFIEVYEDVQPCTGTYLETETETETETEEEASSSASDSDLVDQVKSFWLERELKPTIKAIQGHRRSSLLARRREFGDEAVWSVLEKRATSDFLQFRIHHGRGAPFDWVFGPDNFQKVLDGNYDETSKPKTAPPKQLANNIGDNSRPDSEYDAF